MKKTGHLIRSGGDILFREYSVDGKFTDYELFADDISITIDDPFVQAEVDPDDAEQGVIDYTDEVLGK